MRIYAEQLYSYTKNTKWQMLKNIGDLAICIGFDLMVVLPVIICCCANNVL